MVRRHSGGAMLDFLNRRSISGASPLIKRLPAEMVDYATAKAPSEPMSFLSRLRRASVPGVARKLRRELADLRLGILLPVFARLIGGARTADSVSEGMFRASGEVHRWMYDRRSLREAFKSAGCERIELKDPFESAIPWFVGYELDTVGDRVRKPGSLFMEGIKIA